MLALNQLCGNMNTCFAKKINSVAIIIFALNQLCGNCTCFESTLWQLDLHSRLYLDLDMYLDLDLDLDFL